MTSSEHARPTRGRWAWLLAAGLLAGGVLLVYWRLLLTNRVMATGDALTYFIPYRDYANSALRAGHLPLWNPYLFLGVPFLANPQSAVLYPLHWPFVGLDAARSLVASMGLHLWLAGLGMLLYTRRVAGLSWLPAVAAGLVFSLSGFLGARVGQINQLSAAAWLPWLLWLIEEADGSVRASRSQQPLAGENRPVLPSVGVRGSISIFAFVGLTVVVALQLLAGHTQTSFINLFGLGVAASWPGLAALLAWGAARLRRSGDPLNVPALRATGPPSGLDDSRRAVGSLVGRATVVAYVGAVAAVNPRRWADLPRGGLFFAAAYSSAVHFAAHLRRKPGGSFRNAGLCRVCVLRGRVRSRAGGVGRGLGPPPPLVRPTGFARGVGSRSDGHRPGAGVGIVQPADICALQDRAGLRSLRAPARWMILALFGVSVLVAYGLQAVPFSCGRRLAKDPLRSRPTDAADCWYFSGLPCSDWLCWSCSSGRAG